MIGYINAIQTLGCVDGPGVRVVVFLQGCNLRCKCCHNPETWQKNIGTEYTAIDLVEKVLKYKPYFGQNGGVTLSGGEPLLQAEFAFEFFTLCKQYDIHTCLDTSGSILTDDIKKVLSVTDLVLLDIKYTNNLDYVTNVGCTLSSVLQFLEYLHKQQIATTVRHVIIPHINDTLDSLARLKVILKKYNMVDQVEFLPFSNLCKTKYDSLNLVFPFAQIEDLDYEKLTNFYKLYYES